MKSDLIFLFISILLINKTESYNSAKRWFNDFIYNSEKYPMILPMVSLKIPVIVYMNLSLSQILEVNVKNQILILNVWIYQEWNDSRFSWNPSEYGMISEMQIPSSLIWLPDLVLYNNAGGDWDFSGMSSSKVKIRHDGTIVWKPPFILKSQCDIDVTYFPFDMQTCILKMGTWTHNGLLIDLRHWYQKRYDTEMLDKFDSCESQVDYAMDLTEYMQSYEWDLLEVTAKRNIMKYPCCPEPYLDVTFEVKIKRMTLYYGLNLICPCLSISFMAILVFYLPSYAAEKITLCISVFLALTIFILVVFDLTPSSSRSVPLIVKYLLFTMFLVTISIVASIVVLNISFRQSETEQLPSWCRHFILYRLPRYIMLTPLIHSQAPTHQDIHYTDDSLTGRLDEDTSLTQYDMTWTLWNRKYQNLTESQSNDEESDTNSFKLKRKLGMESLRAIKSHLHMKSQRDQAKDEWVFTGIVIDRVMLLIYTVVVTVGSIVIFLSAPTLWIQQKALSSSDANLLFRNVNYTRLCKN